MVKLVPFLSLTFVCNEFSDPNGDISATSDGEAVGVALLEG